MDQDAQNQEAPEPVGSGSYVVRQGDCIYSIAARAGHLWTTLWDHPRNESLRNARKHPGVLLPGDRVFVPELKVKSVRLESGRRHRIVIDGQTVPLRLRMCDADGEPLAQAGYRLLVGGREIAVTTDDDGTFAVQVPILAEAGRLVEVATGEIFTLHLGHMDPTGSPGAIRKRLANLGYHLGAQEGEMDGEMDEHVEAFLDEFREDAELGGDATWSQVVRRLEKRDPWNS